MEHKGPKKSTNYHNPYWHMYKKIYKEYSQLICEQEPIEWNNLLHGKFLKQWHSYQHYYKSCHKYANHVATACATARLTPVEFNVTNSMM